VIIRVRLLKRALKEVAALVYDLIEICFVSFDADLPMRQRRTA
jgi:hypothetical protein